MLSLLKADMNRQPIPYASCPLIGSRLRLGAHHGVRTPKALYACYDLVSASSSTEKRQPTLIKIMGVRMVLRKRRRSLCPINKAILWQNGAIFFLLSILG